MTDRATKQATELDTLTIPPEPVPKSHTEVCAELLQNKYSTDGSWGEHPEFKRQAWQDEVANGDTIHGYWQWVVSEMNIKGEFEADSERVEVPAVLRLPDGTERAVDAAGALAAAVDRVDDLESLPAAQWSAPCDGPDAWLWGFGAGPATVRLDPGATLAWLRIHRPGVAAQIVCAEHGVRLVQAVEQEVAGMWDWIGKTQACDQSLTTKQAAAIDAVETLGLASRHDPASCEDMD